MQMLAAEQTWCIRELVPDGCVCVSMVTAMVLRATLYPVCECGFYVLLPQIIDCSIIFQQSYEHNFL